MFTALCSANMAVFNRKANGKNVENDGSNPTAKEKVKWSKRPASMSPTLVHSHRLVISQPSCGLPIDTAFKQQRLKAWQPILTPKAVLPTLFLIGIIFAPIGALIVWGSGKVTTITLDYTQCDADAPTDGSFQDMPSGSYDCALWYHSQGKADSHRCSVIVFVRVFDLGAKVDFQ